MDQCVRCIEAAREAYSDVDVRKERAVAGNGEGVLRWPMSLGCRAWGCSGWDWCGDGGSGDGEHGFVRWLHGRLVDGDIFGIG
jgi:hypothetical protein